MSGSLRLALSQIQEIPLQSGTQASVHSTEGHRYVQADLKRMEKTEDAGAGIKT